MRFYRPLSAVILTIALLSSAQPTFACGPFSLEAIFAFTVHPEFPLEKFAGGELGVLQPTLARSYLVVAYRLLGTARFSAREREDLLSLWKERLDLSPSEGDNSWPSAWVTVRQTVPGVSPAGQLEIYRHREKPNQFETYVNCQKDAFETAAHTLSERIKTFGAGSEVIREWVAAQDSVFANCSEGQHLPPPPPAGAAPVIRADRAYQMAAANFYAGNFEEAQKQFEAIAHDSDSEWRELSAYLAGRVFLRKASLGQPEKKEESLLQAESAFKKVLSDRTLAKVHPSATRLLKLVRLRLHPDLRLRELAQSLVKQNNETLKQDLLDYTILFDSFVGDEDSDQTKEFPEALRQDDLSDWIVTVETRGRQALNHAVDRWHATTSPRWLIAALGKVGASDPEAPALLASAEKIDPQSPAFATAAFHQIRLQVESGKVDQARARLDELLRRQKPPLPVSSLNFFLGQRMRLATNLEEVLQYAQRIPAGFSWNEDGRELPADVAEDSDLKSLAGQPLFDADGALLLNEKLPLSVMQQAATGRFLPEHLRRDVAQATWLRAVLQDDSKVATELAPILRTLEPSARPLLDAYLAPQPEDARKFSGIFAWLKLPGLQPAVHSGIGRRSPLDTQDSYRDNWWCAGTIPAPAAAQGDEQTLPEKTSAAALAITSPSFPSFLSEAQKEAARNQQARLIALGPAPNYLCRFVIAWVEKHPADPRAPEALHLAVKTTRYGCTDGATRKWSKAAYDVLHKRFPGNPWTKKTPYWFKD